MPGSPARAILGIHASAAQINAFNIENGYNQSIPIQYIDYLNRLFHLNLGFSYQLNQSVASLLNERLPATIILVGISVLVALILRRAGRGHPGRPAEQAGRLRHHRNIVRPVLHAAVLARPDAHPALRGEGAALPADRAAGQRAIHFLTHPLGLVLPVATLALASVAAFSRYLRSSLLDNLAEEYVRTARAKGASRRVVLYGHVFRNALAPIITLIGLSLPGILGGALITETVFNYPGIGLLFWNSALSKDYPVLLAVTIIVAIGTVARIAARRPAVRGRRPAGALPEASR